MKRFHGESCITAKEVLGTLSLHPLDSLVETSDPEAVLCNKCQAKLNTIHSNELKLTGMKQEVRQLLLSLKKVSNITVTVGEKRSLPIHGMQPPAKQFATSGSVHSGVRCIQRQYGTAARSLSFPSVSDPHPLLITGPLPSSESLSLISHDSEQPTSHCPSPESYKQHLAERDPGPDA